VIDRASPEEISFFCVNPGSLELNIFLKKLIGMVKYGIKTYKGFLDVEKIAVALGQREITILKGLDWMVEMGYLRSEIEGHYQFASEREQVNTNKSQVLQNQINFLLEETNAYRKYLNRIEFDILKSGI
jgi:single-stranded-DNA-specific exonuclease